MGREIIEQAWRCEQEKVQVIVRNWLDKTVPETVRTFAVKNLANTYVFSHVFYPGGIMLLAGATLS